MKQLWRVFQYCRSYPGYALGTLTCAILSTLCTLVFPKLTGLIIDDLRLNGDLGRLAWMTGGLFAAFFFRDVFNGLRIVLNNSFEQNVVYDLRRELYGVMQRLPLGWFDNRATGDLMTRVSEDVTNMERVLIDGIEQGSVSVLQLAGVAALLFWTNAELAWWAILPVPFIFAGVWYYTTTAYSRYRLQRIAASDMNSLLLDNLQGIRQIKSFGAEERELAHFSYKAGEVRRTSLLVMRIWALYSPAMNFLHGLGLVLVVYFGGRIWLRGGIETGELIGFILYTGMFYDPINRLHQLNQLFQAGRAASERVFKIMDTPQEPEPAAGRERSLPVCSGGGRRVEFKNVGFSYEDGREVLKGVDLVAEAGKTIALVGPTGAGKSSIVGLIPRFYRAQLGGVWIDGVAVNDVPLAALRQEIGVVTQEAFLFNASVRFNLHLGDPQADEARLWEALKAANAEEFVKALPQGLETVVGERGVKLSVGEKQRLSIARALLRNPPVLILDEATASVDTATERLIQEALDRLLKERTSFVIAHRLSTIRNADLICVLKHGEIVERGTHGELLARNGLYARLCRAQHGTETIERVFEEIEAQSGT
jgi:ABC-type multidrug transport system fused ATPase/permease subunit